MGKALVIKGVNFATNKLATVSYGETIPCMELALSESAISFTVLNNTVELIAEKTPSNTTDELTWESSNENVATVVDGVVTCVGVGTATITALCGDQTATCSVSSSISIDANTLAYGNGYQFSSTDLSANKDYGGLYTSSVGRIYASGTATESGYKAFSTNYETYINTYPIMMPKNTATIEVQATSAFIKNGQIMLFDSASQQTYLTGTYSNKPCAMVKQYTTGVAPSNGKYVFTVTAEDADSFAFQIGANSISTQTGDVTITFKPAES